MPVGGAGGVQKVVANLVNGLVSMGWLVDVICADAHEGLPGLANSIRVLDMGIVASHGDLKLIKGFRRIKVVLRAESYDALITAPGFSGQVGVLACSGLATKVVVMVDNKLSLLSGLGFMHGLQLKSAQLLYPKAAAVVAAHDSALSDLRSLLPSSCKAELMRIYHPLIPGNVEELAKKDTLAPLPVDRAVVVAAGRLVEEKDFPTLLRAFALVRDKKIAQLVILGDGTLRSVLQKLADDLSIGDSVRFEGMVPNVYSYFSRSSVFVLSSKREAFGNVLIEALACGVPCVATRCSSGGPQEILANGEYGRLVDIGDYEAMAEAILKSIDEKSIDPDVLKGRGADFTCEQSTEGYSALLKRVIK